ncbi:MAG: D-glycerate dehydrogenase [Gemmatimonadaceae bacterium]
MTQTKPRIVITRRLPEKAEQRLVRDYGAECNVDDRQFSADQLRHALQTADIVLCTLTDRLTRDILDTGGRRARMLANFGVGYDHIDLSAAREAGLVVTNTPGALTEDTADVALLLMLAAARRASEGEQELRTGRWTGWRPTHLLGRSVHGATLGIVGLGRIGEAVAKRAHFGFGMSVQALARPRSPRQAPAIVTMVPSLRELLGTSDFVSLHCPASKDTFHLINSLTLGFMKPTSVLINTARGPIVDSAALAEALTQGRIAAAGLDVYEGEPTIDPALLRAPNVTLLPHIGSATISSRTAMGMIAADNIDAFVKGLAPPNRLV